jgi:hypothetical protein
MTRSNLAVILVSLLLVACNTDGNQPSSRNPENFDDFISKFYSDSVFQQSRIAKSLEGVVFEWDVIGDSVIESKWDGKEPFVSAYETVRVTVDGSLQSLNTSMDSIVERIYLENSGFLLERTFKLKEGCWFSARYDVSNL